MDKRPRPRVGQNSSQSGEVPVEKKYVMLQKKVKIETTGIPLLNRHEYMTLGKK